jgi:hypothetical protein
VGPDGLGANAILQLTVGRTLKNDQFAVDDAMSPLDLAIGPGGHVLVSSEFRFGSPEADASVGEYDRSSGALMRVFSPGPGVPFRRPRGLRFRPDGPIDCTAQDAVVAFDCGSGHCLDEIVAHARLNGQSIEFFGD